MHGIQILYAVAEVFNRALAGIIAVRAVRVHPQLQLHLIFLRVWLHQIDDMQRIRKFGQHRIIAADAQCAMILSRLGLLRHIDRHPYVVELLCLQIHDPLISDDVRDLPFIGVCQRGSHEGHRDMLTGDDTAGITDEVAAAQRDILIAFCLRQQIDPAGDHIVAPCRAAPAAHAACPFLISLFHISQVLILISMQVIVLYHRREAFFARADLHFE